MKKRYVFRTTADRLAFYKIYAQTFKEAIAMGFIQIKFDEEYLDKTKATNYYLTITEKEVSEYEIK